ncbi:MAG: hypothetical protein ACTHOP_12595 [Mesorhizobium sp.]
MTGSNDIGATPRDAPHYPKLGVRVYPAQAPLMIAYLIQAKAARMALLKIAVRNQDATMIPSELRTIVMQAAELISALPNDKMQSAPPDRPVDQ